MPPPTTSATSTATLTGNRNASLRRRQSTNPHPAAEAGGGRETKRDRKQGILETAAFLRWGLADVAGAVKLHPVPCVFAVSLLFFMAVEYTLLMVPASAPPFDVGFIATRWLNDLLASSPALNTLLAALNTAPPAPPKGKRRRGQAGKRRRLRGRRRPCVRRKTMFKQFLGGL